jgi:hypothetical protein
MEPVTKQYITKENVLIVPPQNIYYHEYDKEYHFSFVCKKEKNSEFNKIIRDCYCEIEKNPVYFLHILASELKIKGHSKMKKQELVSLLQNRIVFTGLSKSALS